MLIKLVRFLLDVGIFVLDGIRAILFFVIVRNHDCNHNWDYFGLYNIKTAKREYFRGCPICERGKRLTKTEYLLDRIKSLDTDHVKFP